MLNRRYIRVKVFQALYAYFQSDKKEFEHVEKDIIKSVDKIYDLYLYMIALLLEIKFVSEKSIEQAKEKRLPTKEDLDPNLKFVNNLVLQAFEENPTFKSYCANRKIKWHPDEDLIKKLFRKIKDSEEYKKYMTTRENTLEEDKKFLADIVTKIVSQDDLLETHVEEKSIYWSDDLPMVLINLVKTIKACKPDSSEILMPLHKDREDDLEFVRKLYRKTILESETLEKNIKNTINNWEIERIALLDMILMKMALAEMIYFSSIPVKVSLNEYIELSKYYSTPKSKIFINGVLDKLSSKLKRDGIIVKKGRGLVE